MDLYINYLLDEYSGTPYSSLQSCHGPEGMRSWNRRSESRIHRGVDLGHTAAAGLVNRGDYEFAHSGIFPTGGCDGKSRP